MSPAHKQRIVGAIVLVALGLIIVPTVLDFSRNEHTSMKGMEIPPGPDAMQMEVLPLDDWSKKVAPGIERHEPSADAVESTEPPVAVPDQVVAGAPAAGKVERKAAPTPVVTPGEPKTTPAPEVKADTPVVLAPASAQESTPKTAAVAGVGNWVVQVASLTVEAKAIELRDRLRQAGYPVVIEQVKGGAIYRVKAGPVASRAEADKLKQQIKQSTKLDGLVMQNQ